MTTVVVLLIIDRLGAETTVLLVKFVTEFDKLFGTDLEVGSRDVFDFLRVVTTVVGADREVGSVVEVGVGMTSVEVVLDFWCKRDSKLWAKGLNGRKNNGIYTNITEK